jgi:hypothetical protein
VLFVKVKPSFKPSYFHVESHFLSTFCFQVLRHLIFFVENTRNENNEKWAFKNISKFRINE